MDKKNAERAGRIEGVLREFYEEWEADVSLIDLLADARHYADREGLDFETASGIAERHWIREKERS